MPKIGNVIDSAFTQSLPSSLPDKKHFLSLAPRLILFNGMSSYAEKNVSKPMLFRDFDFVN